jgi:hypothetical protein
MTDQPRKKVTYHEMRKFYEERPDEYEVIPHEKGSGFMVKLRSLKDAVVSRGLQGKRCDPWVLNVRENACRGCPALKTSKDGNYRVCGECGCPDIPQNALFTDDDSYSKLMYPRLACPRRNAGFSNAVEFWCDLVTMKPPEVGDYGYLLPQGHMFWYDDSPKQLTRGLHEAFVQADKKSARSVLVTFKRGPFREGWETRFVKAFQELPPRWDILSLVGEGGEAQFSALSGVGPWKALVFSLRTYDILLGELGGLRKTGGVATEEWLEECVRSERMRVFGMGEGIL